MIVIWNKIVHFSFQCRRWQSNFSRVSDVPVLQLHSKTFGRNFLPRERAVSTNTPRSAQPLFGTKHAWFQANRFPAVTETRDLSYNHAALASLSDVFGWNFRPRWARRFKYWMHGGVAFPLLAQRRFRMFLSVWLTRWTFFKFVVFTCILEGRKINDKNNFLSDSGCGGFWMTLHCWDF